MSQAEMANKDDIIGIDEEKFDPDLFEFCLFLKRFGETVVVSGLDGDFMRRPFGKILNLIVMLKRLINYPRSVMHQEKKFRLF
jgi:thymidine kinase